MSLLQSGLTKLLPSAEGWQSLVPGPEEKQPDVIAELFRNYNARIQDPVLIPRTIQPDGTFLPSADKERFYTSMMQDTLSDLFMKYIIQHNKEAVGEIKVFAYLVPDGKELVCEVNDLFKKYSFDPNWKLTQSIAEFDLSRPKAYDPELQQFKKEHREGYFKCWDHYPLSRYRFVYRLNTRRVITRNNPRNVSETRKKPLSEEKAYAKERRLALEILNPEAHLFDAGPYFFTLLRHHEPLIIKIPSIASLFIQPSTPPSSEPLKRKSKMLSLSKRADSESSLNRRKAGDSSQSDIDPDSFDADKLLHAILRRNNQEMLSKMCSIAGHFQEELLFPNFASLAIEILAPAQRKTAQPIDIFEKHKPIKLLEEYVDSFITRIPFIPFSISQLQKALLLFLDQIAQRSKTPTDQIQVLSKLSKLLFKLPLNNDQFSLLIIKIGGEINRLREIELEPLHGNIRKAWNDLFSGNAKKETMDLIIHDLNCETTRLFRAFEPNDLNPGITNFLKPEPSPESRETEEKKDSDAASSETTKEKKDSDAASSKTTKPRSRSNSTAKETPVENKEIEPKEIEPPSLEILFNTLSYYITYRILHAGDNDAVKTAMSACLELTDRMLSKPVINAHLLMALQAALNRHCLSRLEEPILDKLGDKHKKILSTLNQLFGPSSNFKKIRQLMSQSEKPVLPPIGIFKADCEHALQFNKKKADKKEIEDQKKIVSSIVEGFRNTQTLLKATQPVKGQRSDAIPKLYEWRERHVTPLEYNPEEEVEKKDPYALLEEELYQYSEKKWPKKGS